MASSAASTGLLVVGHGTRAPAGQQAFLATVRLVAAELPNTDVRGCFLESVEPNIHTSLKQMAERGTRIVVTVPLLLFAARHVRSDIPAAARGAENHGLTVRHAPALGCHRSIVELSAQRFREAAAPAIIAPNYRLDTLLVFVGRGSRDAQATAEFHEFVAKRIALTPVARVVTCFLAMARPPIESTVSEVAKSPLSRVIVQPHLLFEGELMARLRRIVQEQDKSRQQWTLAPCLGCDRAVARAVADRFRETLAAPIG